MFMKGSYSTDEFKSEAVGQVVDRGYSVKEVSQRIGVSTHSLYKWLKEDSRNPRSSESVNENRDLETENAPRHTSQVSPSKICLH